MATSDIKKAAEWGANVCPGSDQLPTPYYDEDGITIYHGDCREILPKLPKVDLVLTDPPYGINFNSHGQWFVGKPTIRGDNSTQIAEWVRQFVSGIPLVMFFSPFTPLAGFRSVLVWDKGGNFGIGGDRETCFKRDFELIGIENNNDLNGKRDSSIVRVHGVKSTRHVAEKPEALLRYLIGKLGGECILDPFMGSGTTLRAAKDLGRRAIGIEIEEKYCEIAAKRLAQKVLF